jgi:hypothetical protein
MRGGCYQHFRARPLVVAVRRAKNSMHYWNKDNFEGLAAIAEDLA